MTKSPAVVFFGTEEFSAPSLYALISAGYEIACVVTKPDSARGRGRVMVSPHVKTIAIEHNIPVLQPAKLDQQFITDLSAQIKSSNSTLPPLGVLVSYGKIVPQSVIDLFTPGIINIHPSLLPCYRGPSPIESAILNADKKTGITIMLLTRDMDAGPIYTQKVIPLDGTETKFKLYDAFSVHGAKLLIETLPSIIDGSLTPTPQDDSKATYCPLLTKDDGKFTPDTKSARHLAREVRAFEGYPKSYCDFMGVRIIVTKAHAGKVSEPTQLFVTCEDGMALIIDEVIAPSGKKMNADAFIRGHIR